MNMNPKHGAILILAVIVLMIAIYMLCVSGEQLQEELINLQSEKSQLQTENDSLREQVREFQEKEKIYDRMQEWLDKWNVGEAEATFYTLECGTGDGITKTGTKATVGRTVAVDPEVIPLDSRIYILGYGWRIAEDIGGGVQGNVVDIYVGKGVRAKEKALELGRQKVKIVYREATA